MNNSFYYHSAILLSGTVLALWASPANAQCSSDCKTLGYTMTSSECEAGTILKCPFDNSKIYCKQKVKTCTPTTCSGYTLTKCPTNAKCMSCQAQNSDCSFQASKYKVYACNDGYELNSSGTGCVEIPCITESEVNAISADQFIYRTKMGRQNFCDGGEAEWERPLCESKSVKIFKCSKFLTPPFTGIEYDPDGGLTTSGAIAWIKSRYCSAGTRAMCLQKYASVVLSRIACSDFYTPINGQDFSVYLGSMCSFNKYICDWCPESI